MVAAICMEMFMRLRCPRSVFCMLLSPPSTSFTYLFFPSPTHVGATPNLLRRLPGNFAANSSVRASIQPRTPKKVSSNSVFRVILLSSVAARPPKVGPLNAAGARGAALGYVTLIYIRLKSYIA